MDSRSLDRLLQAECHQLESEVSKLIEQIKQATERRRIAEDRLAHVRALLGEDKLISTPNGMPPERRSHTNSRKPDVCDLAERILDERAHDPMYYKDLAVEVMRRGGVLDGKSPAAIMAARLVRDERFVRPTAKGFYALRKYYPNARNVGARRRGRQRTR